MRTAQALWGMDALRVREAFQTLIGNQLLQFTLEALFISWKVGCSFLHQRPLKLPPYGSYHCSSSWRRCRAQAREDSTGPLWSCQ